MPCSLSALLPTFLHLQRSFCSTSDCANLPLSTRFSPLPPRPRIPLVERQPCGTSWTSTPLLGSVRPVSAEPVSRASILAEFHLLWPRPPLEARIAFHPCRQGWAVHLRSTIRGIFQPRGRIIGFHGTGKPIFSGRDPAEAQPGPKLDRAHLGIATCPAEDDGEGARGVRLPLVEGIA